MLNDQSVVCYCRTLYRTTWQTGKPGMIKVCELQEQLSQAT
jgi:hypothetical protein